MKTVVIAASVVLLAALFSCSSSDEPAGTSPDVGESSRDAQPAAPEEPAASATQPARSQARDAPPAVAETRLPSSVPEQGEKPDREDPAMSALGDAADAARLTGATRPGGAQSEAEVGDAVDIQIGRTYNAGTRVRSPELGISFVVPSEWSGGVPDGVGAFLLASNTRPGLGLAMSQRSASRDEVLHAMGQPLTLDESTVLQPQGEPEVEGRWVKARFSWSDGFDTLAGRAMALVDPGGNGVLYVAVGPETEAGHYADLVAGLASSTIVAPVGQKVAKPAAGGSTPLAEEWDAHLRGRRLTYITSYSSGSSGGFSERKEAFLCRDGQFLYSNSSSLSVDTGGASAFGGGQGSGGGEWKVVTEGSSAGIEFRWRDGETSRHLLEFTDGKTYVDGSRWFVTDDNPHC